MTLSAPGVVGRESSPTEEAPFDPSRVDADESLTALLRDLRSDAGGLSSREAQRRLQAWGPNEVTRQGGRRWPRDLAEQFVHPLALLLAAAAVLCAVTDSTTLAVAILAVIIVNAAFAFLQEQHAEHAVEALAAFIPERARVLRDGHRVEIEARALVVGDVMSVEEGDRVCADARLITGELAVDMSMLTGESAPVHRAAGDDDHARTPLDARDRIFSGTACTGGEARAVVTATAMHTELGRISALSERTEKADSPLEQQVKRVAWVISAVAVGVGAAFLPAGVAAGMGWAAAATFAIGMIVANVPEGLLPTITLALALGVRDLARHNAVVKRLSAVETLGSATVICTDKTGTLTQNRMGITRVWTGDGEADLGDERTTNGELSLRRLARAAAFCTTAELPPPDATGSATPRGVGDPTELAVLELARRLGVAISAPQRDAARQATFHFDAQSKRMSTIDSDDDVATVHTKGAPETVLPICNRVCADGVDRAFDDHQREAVLRVVDNYARHGLRVLAVAQKVVPDDAAGVDRRAAESDLTLLGLVAILDPPRPEVADAIAQAHQAGVRVHVVTGDNGLTAAEIARRVGIGDEHSPIVTGEAAEAMSEDELDELLAGPHEIIFARSSPETKLRIADALSSKGAVAAMTGDGVNDAPALRRSAIGIAMGRSGTDVAREAATMVLTDDNFATIVAAIRSGRQVYDNVRKFIVYIFAHTVPEVVPFLVFALSGGAIPLPLNVLLILAIDLGTEIIPSLALSREPAEPGLMQRPPRASREGVITRAMFVRAWGLLGAISAILVMAGFLLVLSRAGWHPGDATGPGTPLHDAYRQAVTMTWVGIVACQIGAGFAARTNRASLRFIGVFSNPWLLLSIASSIVFAAALVYLPWLQDVFGTAPLTPSQLLIVVPFPFIVWGADEVYRAALRRRSPPLR